MPQDTMADPRSQDIDVLTRLQAVVEAENLALELDETEIDRIGMRVIEHFDLDLGSMAKWEERNETAIGLAQMVKKAKDYPWSQASNVAYPLITSAAMQYNARAYPAIVPSTDVVKVATEGDDPDGAKAARAARVAAFMSHQLKIESDEWERGTDQLLLQLPIMGDMFRKVWMDPISGTIRSQVRMPGKHIVINNNAPSVDLAPRISDQIDFYRHELQTHFATGYFRQITIPEDSQDNQKTERFIEQLCRYDIDGDGYDEPYIFTVHQETRKVVRCVAAFDLEDVMLDMESQRIVSIAPTRYLVHYQLIPSMDGTLFGVGLGSLLADLSETINTSLNLMMDSAHLNSLGGGFIATQNLRIKGGIHQVRPGEFKPLNFTGDDIRKGIIPMNFGEPSPILFQLLGMLIDSGREIASVNDIMTGDVQRQNMPVGTVMALIEQGMTVFTASYQRIYRSLSKEFKLIAGLNAKYLNPQKYNAFLDQGQFDPRADFDLSDMDIVPVADPKQVTSMQKMARAQFLLDLAQQGLVDPAVAVQRVLDAAAIENVEELMPKPDPAAQAMAQAQQEMMILEIQMKEMELDDLAADTLRKLAAAQKDMTEVELAPMRARVEQLKQMKESIVAKRERLGGMAGKPRDAAADRDGKAAGQQGQGRPAISLVGG